MSAPKMIPGRRVQSGNINRIRINRAEQIDIELIERSSEFKSVLYSGIVMAECIGDYSSDSPQRR